jgi:uncharacterized protein YcfJ
MILAAVAALALSAEPAPAAAHLPFPAPRAVAVTDKTKCDYAVVLSVEPVRGILRTTTPAGVITYHAGPEVQVFAKDGKPQGPISTLTVGQKVRVYYLVNEGAIAQEVDLE